ncbi:hypothetical protein vseg_012130 [Gypsophila vaccaria]
MIDVTLIKYSDGVFGFWIKEVWENRVVMSSGPGYRRYGLASPKKATPVDQFEFKQRANLFENPKADENWEGSEVLDRPSAAIPLTFLASPWAGLCAHPNRTLGADTSLPTLDPSVELMRTMSEISTPVCLDWGLKGLSKTRVQSGFGGGARQLEFVSAHCGELHVNGCREAR